MSTTVPEQKTYSGKFRAAFNEFIYKSPARIALFAFAAVTIFFTLLLMQPWASHGNGHVPFHHALFVATSATTVTGLTSVDTAKVWTAEGQAVIMAAIQTGGLGIMTIAALLLLFVSKGLGVGGKVMAMNATAANHLGDVGHLLRLIITRALAIEAIIAVLLFPRFLMRGLSFQDSLWKSIFYSISAFNNAGFCIDEGGLDLYTNDYWICTVIMAAVFVGSLGFPVFMVIRIHRFRWKEWNLHAKLTMVTTVALVIVGTILYYFFEGRNTMTFGNMAWPERLFNALFASVNTRSGGFNLVDIDSMRESSHVVSDMLMFIGGGSSSTAGGIKVTTFAVLMLAVVAEAKGNDDIQAFKRRIPETVLRQAISVLVLGATLVAVSVAWISLVTAISLDRVLFEVISAFGTCGLTVGVSAELPPEGLYILSALMFAGRVGSVTLAAALALRQSKQFYRNAEERPAIG
ncbi:MAG: potassium transporter TrkG [Micrococcaceae bacterium]